MHPDVVQDKAGNCPLCKMALVPVRLESIWTCPIHPAVVEHDRGKCKICQRDLIQMTVALTWTCPGRSDVTAITPGRCPDGAAMVATRTLRPHGNHNPQHGGQFFMAPDNWHHIEGAYPQSRVFRLYLYDDYARPLPVDQIKQVRGRVVTKETFDATTHTTKEIASAPLVASNAGPYLEARVADVGAPTEMSAKVRFKDGTPEYRFDFTFAAVTTDPSPAPASIAPKNAAATTTAKGRTATKSATRRSNAARRAAAASTVTPTSSTFGPTITNATPATTTAPAPDPSLIQLPIPDSVPEILTQLKTRDAQVAELIAKGNFAAVFVPAFQAKDLAIALEARVASLPAAQQDAAAPAIERLVRTAWQLDAVGDLGNRQQLQAAYSTFSAAVTEVVGAFAP